MKTQTEQLIAHANQVAKANFMQFDYDEDNPITDLLQAILVIAFDSNLPDEIDLDMGPVYDELSELKNEVLKVWNEDGPNGEIQMKTPIAWYRVLRIAERDQDIQKTIAETHAQLEDIQKLHIIGACTDEECTTCNPKQYPFNKGDDYWTIEGGKVTWSCWDDVSEVIHDNESRRIYFSTEQEAINHLKN